MITTNVNRPMSVHAADLDGDGDLDVLSASQSDDKIAWYENTDGAGTFGAQQVITTAADGAQSVCAGDLDGDGNLDVLSASSSDDKIAWYENTDGQGTFGAQQVMTITVDFAKSVDVGDLDGDGDLDLLVAFWFARTPGKGGKISWYQNMDGQGDFGPQQVITTEANHPQTVLAADLDGDGDLDVLAGFWNNNVSWYENMDGRGAFGPQRVITTAVNVCRSVYAADLDEDGDLDLLSASLLDDKIAWYENTDGAGSFGPQQVITTAADGARSVYAADLDGDGDLDVLSESSVDNKIAWYENTDCAGGFGPQQVITAAFEPTSVSAADLDGDGDLDVLTAFALDNKIAWYENTDGAGGFGPQQVITAASDLTSVSAADLDDDGDLDVLATGHGSMVSWYENTDGQGDYGPPQVITTEATPESGATRSVYAADLDGDGDLDVIPGGVSQVAWYENLLPHPGDANRDGRFDSVDFVQVFQAGEYEDGIAGNSTWRKATGTATATSIARTLSPLFRRGSTR